MSISDYTISVYAKSTNVRYSYDINKGKIKAHQAVLISVDGHNYSMVSDHACLD